MKVLVYREDQKVLVIRKDDNWVLPQFNEENLKELRQRIKEQLSFWVNISGKKEGDLIIASRVFGSQIILSKWVDINEVSEIENIDKVKNLIREDIKYWQDRQFEIIKEVFDSFNEQVLANRNKTGINIYLYGGWGVDFLTGKVSRPHVDIDTLIDIKDKDQARKIIESMGYLIKDKGNKFQNEKNEDGFDVYFVDFDSKVPDAHGNIPTPELFSGAVDTTLNNVAAKVINPKIFAEMLERKIAFNQNNPEGLSGPIEKSEHDLKLVKSYLVATAK